MNDNIDKLKNEISRLTKEVEELKSVNKQQASELKNCKLILNQKNDFEKNNEKFLPKELNEQNYKDFIDFMPLGIAVHKDGKIVFVNHIGLKMLGYSELNEIAGRIILGFIHEDYHSFALRRLQQIIFSGDNSQPMEQLFIKENGEQFYVEVSSTPFIYFGESAILSVFRDISLRKEHEIQIQDSVITYKSILNSVPEAIFIQDKYGTILNINSSAEQMFGYEMDELLGKNYEFIAALPDKLSTIKENIKDVYNGQKKMLNFTGKARDGRIIPTEVSLSSGYYFGEKIVIAVLRDVSKQKEYESKLIDSEKRYRELIDFAVGGILIGSPEGFILEANNYMIKLLGRTRDEVIGKHISEGFFSEESLKNSPFQFGKLKEGQVIINERDILRPDNSLISIEMHTKMMPDKTYQSIYHDITERKRVLTEIVESKQFSEETILKKDALLKAIPDMMFEFDRSGNIIGFYSNNYESLYVPPLEFIGKRADFVLPEEIGALTLEKIDKVFKTKEIEVYTYSLNIDNSKLYYDARLVCVNDDIALAVVRDITDKMYLIEELKESKEKAEEAHRLISAFLGNLSHEIKTPMNGILGFTELLKDEDVSYAERLEFLDVIKTSGKQLIAILNDIIELSKIEVGVVTVTYSEFSVNELLKDIVKMHKVTIPHDKNLKIQLKINENLKESMMFSDKTKLQQIISNLIDNAIKFSSLGLIVIEVSRNANNYVFKVKDNGIGIAKEYHNIIFERFRQVHSQERSQNRGSGLGLSITKAYVELLKGTIYVESELGNGSSFIVIIPESLRNLNTKSSD